MKPTVKRSRSRVPPLPGGPEKPAALIQAFEKTWSALFESPVHLDSALSKQAPRHKGVLAQLLPLILTRPASMADSLGVGLRPGEPWEVSPAALASWRPAKLMAERLHELMVRRLPDPEPMDEDFPPGMLEEWRADWGPEVASRLRTVLAREAPLSLRASRSVGSAGLLRALKERARIPVKAALSDLVPFGVRLAGFTHVLSTQEYEKGAFEIQDEGSQLMSLLALWPDRFGALLQDAPGPRPAGDATVVSPGPAAAWTVVDACAGAGGKSLAIADALGGKGRVYAYDISEKKLMALRRRARRAGLTSVQTVPVVEGKESEVVSRFRRRAQVVLVDAPCSGWGVLRRNPDIKWRQTGEALQRMPGLQKRLLSTYSDLVAPGGTLVYGVCTFRKAETSGVVDPFLSQHRDFSAGPGGYVGPGPTDGFFMQVFRRSL